jgi:hypothetical protein
VKEKRAMTSREAKIAGNTWTTYSRDGYLRDVGVHVREHTETATTCATVAIGRNLHRRDELVISANGNRIEGPGGWYLTR